MRKMYFKKTTLTLALLLGLATQVKADTGLVLVLKNGSTETFILEKKPAITFEGTTININSEEAETTASLAEVENFHFEEVTTNDIKTMGNGNALFEYKDGIAVIEGYKGMIGVYNTVGTLVITEKNENASARLDLNTLTPGVYLVKMGNRTVKVNVK